MRTTTARRLRKIISLYGDHRRVLSALAFHVDADVLITVNRMLSHRALLYLGRRDFDIYVIVSNRRAQSVARKLRRGK